VTWSTMDSCVPGSRIEALSCPSDSTAPSTPTKSTTASAAVMACFKRATACHQSVSQHSELCNGASEAQTKRHADGTCLDASSKHVATLALPETLQLFGVAQVTMPPMAAFNPSHGVSNSPLGTFRS
jgi:hypothetical protein